MAFPAGDVNNFVVGSEEGTVYTASRHGRLVEHAHTHIHTQRHTHINIHTCTHTVSLIFCSENWAVLGRVPGSSIFCSCSSFRKKNGGLAGLGKCYYLFISFLSLSGWLRPMRRRHKILLNNWIPSVVKWLLSHSWKHIYLFLMCIHTVFTRCTKLTPILTLMLCWLAVKLVSVRCLRAIRDQWLASAVTVLWAQ